MKSDLKTGKMYIKDLFHEGRFYNVPEYQRPYMWGQQQVFDLLDDIYQASMKESQSEYFLGTMIWNSVRVKKKEIEYNCEDILDGQQRFITLYLFHAFARDQTEDQSLQGEVNRRLMQQPNEYNNIPERIRIEFSVRDDERFIEEFILKKGGTNEREGLERLLKKGTHSLSSKNMARSILTMHKWIDKMTTESSFSIESFFKFLSNKAIVLFLSTPNNLDDAYNLFTVLNSRGLQLASSDIIKAQNLRLIKDDKKRRRYSRLWDDCGSKIEESLHNFTIDSLLRLIVQCEIKFQGGKTASIHKVFQSMDSEGRIRSGEDTFKAVERYTNALIKIALSDIQCSIEEKIAFENIFFIHTKSFGNRFLMPLVSYYLKWQDYRIIDFLIKIDNLTTMALILDKRPFPEIYFNIIRKIEKFQPTKSGCDEFMQNDVLKYDTHYKGARAMSVPLFRKALEEEEFGSFGGTKINKTKYLLLKLDLFYANPTTRLHYDKARSSVEHIFPKKPNFDVPENYFDYIHKLGNLVLLDVKKNSSLNNSSFSIKRDRYKRSFETRPRTNYVFAENTEWDIESIQRESKACIDMLCDFYSRNSYSGLEEVRSSHVS